MKEYINGEFKLSMIFLVIFYIGFHFLLLNIIQNTICKNVENRIIKLFCSCVILFIIGIFEILIYFL